MKIATHEAPSRLQFVPLTHRPPPLPVNNCPPTFLRIQTDAARPLRIPGKFDFDHPPAWLLMKFARIADSFGGREKSKAAMIKVCFSELNKSLLVSKGNSRVYDSSLGIWMRNAMIRFGFCSRKSRHTLQHDDHMRGGVSNNTVFASRLDVDFLLIRSSSYQCPG